MDQEKETITQSEENTDKSVPQGGETSSQTEENPYQYHYQNDAGQTGQMPQTGYNQNGYQSNGYQADSYQNQYNNTGYNPNYTQNYNEDGMDTRPLSMGEWALTILALMLPCCIGVILYIVWAFSKNGNVNRRNYCRASLVIMAAAVVIYLVVFLMFGSVIFSSFATYVNMLF